MPDENYRNPLREAKHQKDLLKDYFNHVGALAGQEDRICHVNRNYPGDRRSWHLSVLFRTTQLLKKTFIQASVPRMPHKFQTNFPKISKKFQTISKQITSPTIMLINFTTRFFKMPHSKCQNLKFVNLCN